MNLIIWTRRAIPLLLLAALRIAPAEELEISRAFLSITFTGESDFAYRWQI
jgi:hypothetical protein